MNWRGRARCPTAVGTALTTVLYVAFQQGFIYTASTEGAGLPDDVRAVGQCDLQNLLHISRPKRK
jgi:hypothetical protein